MKQPSQHIVPLSRQAIEVLELLHNVTGEGALLFPGEQDSTKPMSNNTVLFALYRLGYRGKMCGHGFRGVMSTCLNEMGYPSEHIELQLAHQKRDRVKAAYDHAKHMAARTRMMQAWGNFLEQTQRSGKVIEFPAHVA
jgi:integrase